MAVIYLLHLNESSFNTQIVPVVNSAPGGLVFQSLSVGTDPGGTFWFGGEGPFGQAIQTEGPSGSRVSITSTTQVTLAGAFCLEGFADTLNDYGTNLVQFSTDGTNTGLMRIRVEMQAGVAGGSYKLLCYAQAAGSGTGFLAFTTGDITPLAGVAGMASGFHWALTRSADGYLAMYVNGARQALATTPIAGSLTGYIDAFGSRNRVANNSNGGYQMLVGELRGTDGSEVYTGATYTVPTARFADPAGGDVTVALTGAQATTQAGTVTQSRTRALTGLGLTASRGTVTQSRTLALTGIGSASEVGTVTPSAASDVTVALSGTEATTQAGDTIETLDAAVTGVEATAGVGSVSPDVSVALVGQGLTAALGDMARSVDVGLAGAEATAIAGDTLPNLSAGATGVEATATVGNVSAGTDVIVELTGQGVAVATGAVVPSAATALSGQAVTAAAGLAVPGATAGLTGTQIATAHGSVSAGSDVTVQLTGQGVVAAAGALVPGMDRLLTGAEAEAAFGALGSDVVVALSGSGAAASTGTISAETPPTGWMFGTIGAESRQAVVGAETRSATIGAESRTWSITR